MWWIFNFSYNKTPNLIVFREIFFWNENVSLLNKNRNVYCWGIVINSPRVNAENCKLYDAFNKRLHDGFVRHLHVIWLCWPYVLQMGRSELKYGFYCQNLAHFLHSCIFQFFIKKALPTSNSVQRQNFMGKNVKDIEITSWKAGAYGIFTRVGFVSEISLVRCAHSFDFRYFTNSCENPVRTRFPWSNLYIRYEINVGPQAYETHLVMLNNKAIYRVFNGKSKNLKKLALS